MKLYTRGGDKGKTSIIGGRVDKDDLRVEAYGTVDEANGFIGQAVAELDEATFADLIEDLTTIQHELFDCGGDLANKAHKRPYKMEQAMINVLEQRIDVYTEEAPALQRFILPGGARAAAILHTARTVTRRAERNVVSLIGEDDNVVPLAQPYLNRLSDFFFAAARVVNVRLGYDDVEYVRGGKVMDTKPEKH